MMVRRVLTLFFIVVGIAILFVVLAGYSPALAQAESSPTATPLLDMNGTPFPSSTPTLAPTATTWPEVIPLIVSQDSPVGYGPFNFPPDVNPLTGLVVDDPSNLERRPMIVKVTNYPRTVRPQSGLSRADIVYEYYMERGISRFIAIFYGQDAEKVGPVRSGRFFDEHIFKMYDGFFVFGSADYRVMDFFLNLGWHWVSSFVFDPEDKQHGCFDESPRFLCRDFELVTYNNLFTNTDALERYVTRRNGNYRPDLSGMRFQQVRPPGGQNAANLYIRYSLFIYTWWEYIPQMGKYIRYEEEIGFADPNKEKYIPHIDKLTGKQLSADNVVVLVVPHYYFVKTKTTEILTIPLIGKGQAYVFREGVAYPATWVRPDENGVLQLYSPDGEPFPLKPGNTWFQVVSLETVLANNTNEWRFYFSPPEVPEDLGKDPINPDGENAPFGWYEDEVPDFSWWPP